MQLSLFYMFGILTVLCGREFICLSECEYVYVSTGVTEVRGQKHWMPLELMLHAAGSYSV